MLRLSLQAQRDALWQLLDDIDTLDDAAREYDDVFRERARAIIKKRWEIHNPDERAPLSPNGPGMRLPDGSGCFVASWPLPKTHWIYAEGHNEPSASLRLGIGAGRTDLAGQIREAARYAIRASTMNGKEMDFDPDAMVQNIVVGLLGLWTEDGR